MFSSCGTMPILARAWRGFSSISVPQTLTVPVDLITVPAMMLMKVDLPAPFGPSSPKTVPAGMSRSKPFSACFDAPPRGPV